MPRQKLNKSDSIIGKKIVAVRCLTPAEVDGLSWDVVPTHAIVLVLDDGSQLFAARDQECNDAGALFLFDGAGDHLISNEAGLEPVIRHK